MTFNTIEQSASIRRRLYGDYVRLRRRILANRRTYTTSTLFEPITIQHHNNHSMGINSFEFYNSLKDVKIGLDVLSLINKTDVLLCEDDYNETCVICQDELKKHEILRKFKICKHIFHINCIEEWLSGNKLCPCCRR